MREEADSLLSALRRGVIESKFDEPDVRRAVLSLIGAEEEELVIESLLDLARERRVQMSDNFYEYLKALS